MSEKPVVFFVSQSTIDELSIVFKTPSSRIEWFSSIWRKYDEIIRLEIPGLIFYVKK